MTKTHQRIDEISEAAILQIYQRIFAGGQMIAAGYGHRRALVGRDDVVHILSVVTHVGAKVFQ